MMLLLQTAARLTDESAGFHTFIKLESFTFMNKMQWCPIFGTTVQASFSWIMNIFLLGITGLGDNSES